MKYTDDMNDINVMIDDCISNIASDGINEGVEQLYDLASKFKTAGATAKSFMEICTYIEREAVKKSDQHFVSIKLQSAMRMIREKKTGKIIVSVH